MNKLQSINRVLARLNKITFAVVGVIASLWLALELILKLLGR